MRAELGEILGKANQMQSSIVVSAELLKENVPNNEWIVCISEMQGRLLELSTSLFKSYRAYFSNNRRYSNVCKKYNYAVQAIVGILYRFGEQLEVHFFSNRQIMDIAVGSWKYALSIRKSFLQIFRYIITVEMEILKNPYRLKLITMPVKLKHLILHIRLPKQEGAILRPAYMALMTVLRYGHLGVFVTVH